MRWWVGRRRRLDRRPLHGPPRGSGANPIGRPAVYPRARRVSTRPMQFTELGPLSLQEWVGLVGRDRAVFGPSTVGLVYRPKDHHVGVRDADGALVAAIGATIATVEVDGHEPFEVVGVGGLIVRKSDRGKGLSTELMDRLTALVNRLGPDRAMNFCERSMIPVYARRGYRAIEAPVCVDQPDGPILMPTPAMWRPIRPSEWPAGAVRVHGCPF